MAPSLAVAVIVILTSSPVAVYEPTFTVDEVPVKLPDFPSEVVYFALEAPSTFILTFTLSV